MLAVIPQPVNIVPGKATFDCSGLTSISAGNASREIAQYVAELLDKPLGKTLVIGDIPSGTAGLRIALNKSLAMPNDEGYRVAVSTGGVVLEARVEPGLIHGAQSVLQMLAVSDTRVIPCCEITDYPRFRWRGSLLDAGRYFWTVADTKRYIDLLALYKMNVFHWHLTEDQGWRIEIKKYPKLTSVGAWRVNEDGNKYGGFYTQAQIRDIVAYAGLRGITVVPEIEMPGHSVAALAAYPELSCTGGPFAVRNKWGVSEDVYCAGSERVFAFVEDVLREVMGLFPSRYIHIGGDECPKKRWEQCPKCRGRMADEKLGSAFELQKYFINRVEKFLAANGRVLVGWDEILESGAAGVGHQVKVDFSEDRSAMALTKSAVVQSWRGIEGGIAAAKTGHDVIMSPTTHCYLDYGVEGYPTRKAYGYEPVAEELTDAESKHVLGLEGNVWTEGIADRKRWDYMVFPRLCALAEVGWSPVARRNWDDFKTRLKRHDTILGLHQVEFWQDPEVWS